jgi:hypothetical protein
MLNRVKLSHHLSADPSAENAQGARGRSNNEMQLTRPVQAEASQLISSVRPSSGASTLRQR